MINRFVVVLLILLLASGASAADRLPVVASFSILGEMVARVGGDRVEVTTLVGPNADAHIFQPAPADARKVASARLVVLNGLGFEGWAERLTRASGNTAPVVIATAGIKPRRAPANPHEHKHKDERENSVEDDPHAFQDLQLGLVYVDNILAGLCQVDAAGCDDYRRNAEQYRTEMKALHEEVRRLVETVPTNRRSAVTAHDALGYFAAAYGLNLIPVEGLNPDSEPSAKEIAALIRMVRESGAIALFAEAQTGSKLIEQIARETNLTIGGILYTDALSEPAGPAPSYLALIRHNARTIVTALAPPAP